MLKHFFDISTGFRYKKIEKESSVHLQRCPWISQSKLLHEISYNKQDEIAIHKKTFFQLCEILPAVSYRQALYKWQYTIPSCKVFSLMLAGRISLQYRSAVCMSHHGPILVLCISFWDTWYLCTCYGLLLVDVLGCQKFPLPHPLGSAVSESSRDTVYIKTVTSQRVVCFA